MLETLTSGFRSWTTARRKPKGIGSQI